MEGSALQNINVTESFMQMVRLAKKRVMDPLLANGTLKPGATTPSTSATPATPGAASTPTSDPKSTDVASVKDFTVTAVFDLERRLMLPSKLSARGSGDSFMFRLSAYPSSFESRFMIDISPNHYSTTTPSLQVPRAIVLSTCGADLGSLLPTEQQRRLALVRLQPGMLEALLARGRRASSRFTSRLWFGNLSSPNFFQFLMDRMAPPVFVDDDDDTPQPPNENQIAMRNIAVRLLDATAPSVRVELKQWPIAVSVDTSGTGAAVAAAASPRAETASSASSPTSAVSVSGENDMKSPKKGAANWVPDKLADNCTLCSSLFTFWNRKHHCRVCLHVVCNSCSKTRKRLRPDARKEARICDRCTDVKDAQDEARTSHVTFVMNDTQSVLIGSASAPWLDRRLLEVLDLSFIQMGDAVLSGVCLALTWNSSLKALNLSQSLSGPGQVVALLEALLDHPTLAELIIQQNGINSTSGAILARYLTRAPSLQILDMSHNKIGAGIEAMFAALPFAHSLQRLHVQYNGIHGMNDGGRGVWKTLKAHLTKAPKLHTLDLSGNLLDRQALLAITEPMCSNTASTNALELHVLNTTLTVEDIQAAQAELSKARMNNKITYIHEGPRMSAVSTVSPRPSAASSATGLVSPRPSAASTISPRPTIDSTSAVMSLPPTRAAPAAAAVAAPVPRPPTTDEVDDTQTLLFGTVFHLYCYCRIDIRMDESNCMYLSMFIR
jgi:hypothetical protein